MGVGKTGEESADALLERRPGGERHERTGAKLPSFDRHIAELRPEPLIDLELRRRKPRRDWVTLLLVSLKDRENPLAFRHARGELAKKRPEPRLPVVRLARWPEDRRPDGIEIGRHPIGEFGPEIRVQESGTPGDRIQAGRAENDFFGKQAFEGRVGAPLHSTPASR